MSKQKRLYLVLLVLVSVVGVEAFSQGRAADHDVIKPYPGSTLIADYYVHKNHETTEMPVTEKDTTTNKSIAGEYWELTYEIRDANGDADPSISGSEIAANYCNAAREKGGTVLYNQDDVVTFTVPADDGGVYWGYLEAFTGKYSLWIVKEKPLETKLQFGAEQMKQELDKAGRVAVYGINFDVNKAFLKAGSEKVIAEMVKLMLQNPELRVEIQGHTDSTGTAERNLELSKERASTVKSFMLLYGIAPERLETSGHGDTAPLESNDTEAGRAKNRRVELVKRG